jgi:hypothetical protein
MDWSLLQPNAKKPFLRDVRAYKNPNWYYLAMIIDPIIRFNWIFYAIYIHDLNHNTLCSFLVGLSEVTRRGMWTAFRVENEHCANVARFKAFRDIPLPYDVESSSQESLAARTSREESTPTPATTTGASISPALSRHRSRASGLEAQESPDDLLRLRKRTFTNILADAHTQDFEKKRQPGAGDSDNLANRRRDGSPVGADGAEGGSSDDDDEDDDEQDEEDVLAAEGLLRDRSRGREEGRGGGEE